MPIALDANEVIEVVLATDLKKPEAERPTFVFTHLPTKKKRELDRLMDAAFKAAGADDANAEDEATCQGIMIGLKRVTHCPELASPDVGKLDDHLTIDEKWELLTEWRKGMLPSAAEKKASSSQSASPTESSAPAVGTASAPASPQ